MRTPRLAPVLVAAAPTLLLSPLIAERIALAGILEVHDPTLYTEWADPAIGSNTAGFVIVDGLVYILDGASGTITTCDTHGRPRGTLPTGLTGYGGRYANLLAQHRWARSSASQLGGEMLVADPDHGRVLRVASRETAPITGDEDGEVQFVRPVAVVQGRTFIRVLDAGRGEVISLRPDLTLGPVVPACGAAGAGVDPVAITVRPLSQDLVRLVPRPADALASVADCTNQEYYLGASQLGVAAFSDGARWRGSTPSWAATPGIPRRSG